MSRIVWLVLLGAVVGSAGVAISFNSLDLVDARGRAPDEDGRGLASKGERLPVLETFSIALAATEKASAASGAAELEAMIAAAAREPPSARRDVELEAFVARLAELDAAEAVRVSMRYALPDPVLAAAYRSWAAPDATAALRELPALRPHSTQLMAALALLEVLGYDEQGIATIAAAFPPSEARSFRLDAIVRVAERDIHRALALVDVLAEQAARTIVVERIADVAAAIDPRAGLEQASALSDAAVRRRFRDRLLEEWAKVDPGAALAYLETADVFDVGLSDASFRALAASGPERLLALAERFSPALRGRPARAAVEVLAASDPVAAYERVSAMPSTVGRNALIDRIARIYADKDPEAALAWATSLEPRSSEALDAVMIVVAAKDPLRAAELSIAEIVDPAANRGEMPSVPGIFPVIHGAPPATVARIADLLHTQNDPRVRAQLQGSFIAIWAQEDPRAATDWVVQNPSVLTPATAGSFAWGIAYAEPTLAKESVQSLPPHLRAAWIQGAASRMGERDLDGTLAWIETMGGYLVHERALEAALSAGATRHPLTVASYLERMPALEPQLAVAVASAWAEQDAPAAAGWLTRRTNVDEETLSRAVAGVAAAWASADASAAERWVRGLPSAAVRDQGVAGLVGAAARRGEIEARLLDAFSSQAARDRALAASMYALAQTNVLLARRLVTQIADPALRARAESGLEEGASLPGWLRTAPSGGGR